MKTRKDSASRGDGGRKRTAGAWSEAATRVLRERYLLRDAAGTVVETPDELVWRVSRAVAEAEKQWKDPNGLTPEDIAGQFYDVMVSRQFLPNSPTLMNAGKGNNLQLSACYVVPVPDSLEGIFDAVKHAALIHQSGGGTGFSFSRLRPEGSMVASTHGVASGPVSFMKIFDGATEAVKQGGCVTPDTRVSTSAGMVRIGTLGPLDAAPKSWHALKSPMTAATDEGQRRVEEFYHNGVAAIRRIRTSAGYRFTGTLEHRVRVIDETGAYVWRHLKDLRAGDWMALQKHTYPETTDYRFPASERVPHPNARAVRIPDHPTAELGEFIGYFIGDGSVNYYNHGGVTGRLALTVADKEPEIGARLLELARDLFGITPLEHRKPNDASVTYFFNATELVAWLKHIGVTKASALKARVPEIVFQAGAEFARGFLRGLFSADGTITSEGYASLYSVSRELIEETQQLLLALGVPSAISVTTNRETAFGDNPIYRLRLMTREGLNEFAASIGFISTAKTERLAAGLDKAWEFNDVLPHQEAVVAGVYQGPGRGSGLNRGSRGANHTLYRDLQHYMPGVSAPRNLTRSRLRTLAEKHSEVRESALAAFLTNGQFYDQVVEITEGEELTVDLSVAENHTYIANGFVSHNSRRGANMGILRVDHPDVLKFIDCKRDGSVTNFNISVAITDEFMRAYEADTDYALIDPHTNEEVRRLRAHDVMERIIDAAWATGDPGLVFLDRANRSSANPTPEIELLEATNPCVVGETRLATSQGLIRMDTLFASGAELVVATDARSWSQTAAGVVNGIAQVAQNGVIFQPAVPVFKTGEQVPVRKLITSHGMEITATLDHRFLTTDGYKRLDQLEFGDTLLMQSGEGAWSTNHDLPQVAYGVRSEARLKTKIARGEAQPPTVWTVALGETLGYALGDGHVRRDDTSDILGFAVAQSDEALADTLTARIAEWFGAQGNRTERQGHTQLTFAGSPATFFMALGLTASRASEKRVPESVFTAPRDAVVGFLRGLFSADGSVQIGSQEKGTCSVRLATSSKGLALDTQQLLLNMGIVSAVRLRREASVALLPNAQREPAEYATQAQYEVIIDKANRDRFASEIGFMQPEKQARLVEWIGAKKRASNFEAYTTNVAVIEDAGLADVYDTTVPEVHSIVVNGLVTHQCGEQWLGPYDACNLGSINLGLFVHDGEIDWEEMERVTRLTTRFLDDVIDINPFPLEEVREKVHSNRRIGLGVMGWAEMLFELGLRYDSEEATMLGQRVMRAVQDWATDESARLAEVRGPFKNFSRSIYKHDRPLRNSTRTTVAPTGSISILADCSSGIEPIFALAFQHKVKQPDGTYRVLDFVNPFFQRALEASDIEDKASVLEYVKEHGALHGHPAEGHPALRPYVTAHDIAPEWHIRMQAAFQQGVDNSISKTINLPNSATRQDVGKAYMQAWATGCLGITVFRDGCKDEQVLNVGVKSAKAAAQPATPSEADLAAAAMALATEAHRQRFPNGRKSRPEVMQGYTRQVRAPEGKVNVTLNSDEDGVLEVFINIGKAGSDVAALAEALGRLISIHLQIDSSLTQNERADEVAHQLRSIGGSTSIGFGENRVRSLPDAVGRALELHIAQITGAAPVVEADAMATPSANGVSTHSDKPALGERQRFTTNGNLCPTCGNSTMYYEEGCKKCVSCGYSEC